MTAGILPESLLLKLKYIYTNLFQSSTMKKMIMGALALLLIGNVWASDTNKTAKKTKTKTECTTTNCKDPKNCKDQKDCKGKTCSKICKSSRKG